MKFINWLSEFLETVGAVLSALAMVGCFVYGFIDIGKGFGFVSRELVVSGGKTSSALLDNTLAGLEMFFLAPLPFLAFLSITKLFRAVTNLQNPALFEAAHKLLQDVKRLIAGLIIAVVATEMVHRIVLGSDLTWTAIVAILGLICSLSLYYWASK